MNDVGKKTQLGGQNDPASSTKFVAGIINASLSVLGALLVGLLVYGGYKWMIARGDSDKVTDAKDTITNAVIGLVIVLTAFAVSRFVLSQLIRATST